MTSWQQKLDPHGRRAVDEAPADDDRDLDVALRLNEPGAIEEVIHAGLELHATIGSIVTGRVRGAEGLRRIASLSCVDEVQLSRPMYDDRR
jgi:hypothetical protein